MIRVLVSAVFAIVAITNTANADLYQFNVLLDGLQEVPPNASPGTGSAIVFFDDVSGGYTVTGSFSGLIGNVTAAHVHGFAGAGVNAVVLIPLSLTGTTNGTITGGGTITNTGSNFASVLAGLTYINIHSNVFPGGEIRGQVTNPIVVPEPSFCLLGLAGIAVYMRRRQRSY